VRDFVGLALGLSGLDPLVSVGLLFLLFLLVRAELILSDPLIKSPVEFDVMDVVFPGAVLWARPTLEDFAGVQLAILFPSARLFRPDFQGLLLPSSSPLFAHLNSMQPAIGSAVLSLCDAQISQLMDVLLRPLAQTAIMGQKSKENIWRENKEWFWLIRGRTAFCSSRSLSAWVGQG
jgi:hypothetical protein